MPKMLIMVGLVVLAVSSPGMAQADGTPVLVGCLGTGGYNGAQPPEWQFQPNQVTTPLGTSHPTCNVISPDDSDPSLGVPPAADGDLDLFQNGAWLVDQTGVVPVANVSSLELAATGDFACGAGTLNGTGSLFYLIGITDGRWTLDWTATLDNGVGPVTGTATRQGTGEIRTLSGDVFIEDGAHTGQCDDSAGAENVAVHLVLS